MPLQGVMGHGVLSGIAHRPTMRTGAMDVFQDLYTFMVLDVSAGVPSLEYGTTVPIG